LTLGKRTAKHKPTPKLVVEFRDEKTLVAFERKAKRENSDRCKATRILVKKYLAGEVAL